VRSDPKRRYDALVSLKKIGDPNAIDTFYEMLTDPSPKIRRISIEALGAMGK
jgi:HEAT repeat protein